MNTAVRSVRKRSFFWSFETVFPKRGSHTITFFGDFFRYIFCVSRNEFLQCSEKNEVKFKGKNLHHLLPSMV